MCVYERSSSVVVHICKVNNIPSFFCMAHWAASCFAYIKVVSTRLLTSKGIMYINSIDMVWLLSVKVGAVQATYLYGQIGHEILEILNRSAAYCVHFRSILCANGSTSYCAHSAVYCAEIPHNRCISAAQCAEIPHDRCDCRSISCGIPQGPIRKLVSIWLWNLLLRKFSKCPYLDQKKEEYAK